MRNKRKNGFISMTLVYTFLIIFLFLMLAILRAYTEKNKFIEEINSQIDDDISQNKVSKNTLINRILEDNTPLSDTLIDLNDDGTTRTGYRIKLFQPANAGYGNGNGLFFSDDENVTDENNDGVGSRIYYFRGSVENNHVTFAGKCWRIIRTNEDGSIRVRYNGVYSGGCPTVKDVAGETPGKIVDLSIGSSAFRDDNTASYVASGYTVASETNNQSEIIRILNNWFIENFITNKPGNEYFSYYVSDSFFCSDLSLISSNDYKSKGLVPRFASSTSENIWNDSNIMNDASFVCSDRDYMYDVGGQGNNLLLYPIGLLTAQDLVFAGGYMTSSNDPYLGGARKIINNESFYLFTKSNFWTISPYDKNETAKVVSVNNQGLLNGTDVGTSLDIIPVISLKPSLMVKGGNGTSTSPYVLE